MSKMTLTELYNFSMPGVVVLNKNKMKTTRNEKIHLAHELGHCQTGSFYRIDTLETCERAKHLTDR